MNQKKEFKYDPQDPWKHSLECLVIALGESCTRLGWVLKIERQTDDLCKANARLFSEHFFLGIEMNFILDSPARGAILLRATQASMPQDNKNLVLQECVSLLTHFERNGTRLLNLLSVQIDEQKKWVYENGAKTGFAHGAWRLASRQATAATPNERRDELIYRGKVELDRNRLFDLVCDFVRDANRVWSEPGDWRNLRAAWNAKESSILILATRDRTFGEYPIVELFTTTAGQHVLNIEIFSDARGNRAIASALRDYLSDEKQLAPAPKAGGLSDSIVKEISATVQTLGGGQIPNKPENELTPLQQKIVQAVKELKIDYVDPPDELVAAKIGLNQRGQPYTRETINRERQKLRELKIEV